MADIDWSATGSMVGGIGSIIAVGVAVGLSELQHRRTLRLVRDQERDRIQREESETRVLAYWASTRLFDLRNQAEKIGSAFGSIKLPAAQDELVPDAALPAMLEGLNLRFEPWSPRLLDAVPRFSMAAALPIYEVARRAAAYDVQNQSSALLARNGRLTTKQLTKRLHRKSFVLRELVEQCDLSYRALAEEFGFEPLETQLALHAATKAKMAEVE